MIIRPTTTLVAAIALCAASASAGTKYQVSIDGQVEFNLISSGPLSFVNPGEAVNLSFTLDSDDFINSPNFPTRGYRIDPSSWTLQFQAGSAPLQVPYSAPELLFVIRNNDPAVDGFLVSSNVDNPSGVPLGIPGGFGPFENSFYVTYGPDEVPSLDIADAVGFYDFTGLTVFNWTIDDGPFNALGMIFEDMTVTEVLAGSATVYGCGTNPAGAIAVAGGSPTIGQSLLLDVDNPLGTQAPGSIAGAYVGFAPTVLFPCGLPVPGLGMAGPGANGELLVDSAEPSLILLGTPWGGAGSPSTVDIAIPADPVLVGLHAYAQGFIVDPVAAQGVGIGITDAVDILIGS